MAIEGLAVYGSVTASLGAINIIKTWIQELRQFHIALASAQQTIDALELSCAASQISLENWANMWGINERTGKQYPRGLWGAQASMVIMRHLESVKSLHEGVTELLSPLSTATSARKSLQIVMSAGPKAKAKLEHITQQMGTVKELSKEAFELKHRMEFAAKDTNKTLQDAQKSIFFGMAYSSRSLWSGLYDSCREAKDSFNSEEFRVKLDVFRLPALDPVVQVGHTMSPIRLRYSILFQSIPWVREREFAVEGPLPLEQGTKPELGNLHLACLNAQNSSGPQFFKLQNGMEKEWFGLSVPPTTQQILSNDGAEEHLKCLTSMLYDLNLTIAQQPLHLFPLRERIRFAFKVAECGFFLCGTPWLLDLKAANITTIRDGDSNRHFLLETKGSNFIGRDDRMHYFLSQIFAIGKLLVEVGIGRTVTPLFIANTLGTRPDHVFKIDGKQIWADEAIEMAGTVMGLDYAAPVRACLYPNKTWAEARGLVDPERHVERYQKALQEYYTCVYLPLKSLKDKVNQEFEEDNAE